MPLSSAPSTTLKTPAGNMHQMNSNDHTFGANRTSQVHYSDAMIDHLLRHMPPTQNFRRPPGCGLIQKPQIS